MADYTFSFKNFSITYNNYHLVDFDGEAVLSFAEQDWEYVKSSSGSGHFVQKYPGAATLTVPISYGSPGNVFLSQCRKLGLQSGSVAKPLAVTDLRGGTVLSVDRARIQGRPGETYGETKGPAREWVFLFGSSAASDDINDNIEA